MTPLPGTNLMLVPVAINGTPKQFLLDIGTNPTEVSQAAVTQLGLPENTKGNENIGANNGSNMQPQRRRSIGAHQWRVGECLHS